MIKNSLLILLALYGFIQIVINLKVRKQMHFPSFFSMTLGSVLLLFLSILVWFNCYQIAILVLALMLIQLGSIFNQFKIKVKIGIYEQILRLLMANLILVLYYLQTLYL